MLPYKPSLGKKNCLLSLIVGIVHIIKLTYKEFYVPKLCILSFNMNFMSNFLRIIYIFVLGGGMVHQWFVRRLTGSKLSLMNCCYNDLLFHQRC